VPIIARTPEDPVPRQGGVGSAARVRHCVGLVGMVFALARLGGAMLTVVFAFSRLETSCSRVGGGVMELCYVHGGDKTSCDVCAEKRNGGSKCWCKLDMMGSDDSVLKKCRESCHVMRTLKTNDSYAPPQHVRTLCRCYIS
jgi:hypothetical protein